MKAYTQTKRELFNELRTSDRGLSENEARKRLAAHGLNEIKEEKPVSPLIIFFSQFKSFIIGILLFAVVISLAIHEYIDAAVIGAILILNAVLGFVQEYRAEKSIAALKKLTSLKAVVIRDGKEKEIDAIRLVPGDIALLETGEKIPADCRIIESIDLQSQEAALTGESMPVRKNDAVLREGTHVADRRNMVFAGTIITTGRGKAIVVDTGMRTEIGKIAEMIQEAKQEPTPLQKKMKSLGVWLGAATIVIALIVLTAGLFKGIEFGYMLVVALSLAVAAIPEGLPAVVTIGLALGVQRMVKRNALVRTLPSVETLGSTTVICTDKTGTLTLNQMTVRKIFANNKEITVSGGGYSTEGGFYYKDRAMSTKEIELMLEIGALCNDSKLTEGEVIGDPTEGALIVSAAKAGLIKEELEAKYPRFAEIQFTSERKRMSTFHEIKGKKTVYCKGAPDVLLELCDRRYIDGEIQRLTRNDKKKILQMNEEFAKQALRVLGFAYKESSKPEEKDMVWVGLQGMIDPPREEAKEAIAKCRAAGIKVIMITGDFITTAKAIGKELGIEGIAVDGKEIDCIKDLKRHAEDIGIYARVDPRHKVKILEALQANGHVVAMTGDGVNDAPALKRADIGIAMGISGTDVAKEASDMVLTDDNFASIVNAVEEGRGTYGNIKKYVAFLLSGNISEILIIFIGMLIGLPLPLTATQILLINLVTDGLPALALSRDPFEPNAMQRGPKKQNESIFRGLNPFIIYYPIAMTVVALSVFSWFYFKGYGLPAAQTATFLTMGMFELYQSLSSRSTIYPALKVGLFKNKLLIAAFMSSLAIMAVAIFIPAAGIFLDMVPLKIGHFVLIAVIASTGAIIIEITKYAKTKNEVISDEHAKRRAIKEINIYGADGR